jgi:hypothetical protein
VAKRNQCFDPVAHHLAGWLAGRLAGWQEAGRLGIVPLNASNLAIVAGLATRTEHANR